ncbi:MAG: hypothetical protein AB1726_04160 [Planctomycetota bacterium]
MPASAVPVRSRRPRALGGALLAGLLLGACGDGARRFGAPLRPEAGIPVSALAAAVEEHLEQAVVVRGRVESVCQTAGCWCVLEEGGAKLYVSIAAFALPAEVAGRECRAAGRLVLRNDRPTLLAEGLDFPEE